MALSKKRFSRKIENFVCEVCGANIKGTGYTDHCPNCLWGKHVDVNPGDRASGCGGLMKPVGAVFEKDNYTITYTCLKCGERKRFRAAPDDDRELLVGLLQR